MIFGWESGGLGVCGWRKMKIVCVYKLEKFRWLLWRLMLLLIFCVVDFFVCFD